jgi:septal ring factor EnvC (AmiA/AmiB activator)
MLLMIVVVVATAADTGTALGAALTGIAAVVGALWVIVKSIRSERRVDRQRLEATRDELAQLRAEKREWERDRVEMERELKRVEREWDSARDTANRLRRELADERDDHRR